MKSKFIFLSLLFLMSSCAELGSPRSFVDEMDRESDGFWVAGRDFPVVGGDSGVSHRSREEIKLRTPMNEKQRDRYMNREVIKRQLEEREEYLSDAERSRYVKDSQYLASTSERIYYLSLPPSERSEYIRTKQPIQVDQDNQNSFFSDSSSMKSSSSLRAPASLAGDVSIGMNKEEVKRLWGKPMRVDIAGDPRNQNERWVYYEGGRMKQLYFEAGRVEGWTLE